MRLIRLLKKDLAKEATLWVQQNIISEPQAEAICAQYDVDYHNPDSRSYGYFVLVGLGYLFIGLAVITLLSANWDEIPRAVRMAGVILLTLSVNLFGLWQFYKGNENLSSGFLFLGGLFYGAAIMLIAQIYHIGEHYPDGVFWWAMGVLPMAILLRSLLLMYLAVTLGFIWFFVESSLHYFPVFFPVFLLAAGWYVLKVKQSNLLFLSVMIGFALWLEYCLAWVFGDFQHFKHGAENVLLVAGIFLLFHGVSKWLVQRQDAKLIDYGTILAVWALRFAIFTLIIFSFDFAWEELINARWEIPELTIFLTLFLPLLAIGLEYLSGSNVISISSFSLVYIVSTIFVMNIQNDVYALYFQLVDNIFLVTCGIWLVIRGIQSGISHYFFLGVAVILITGLLRYIDLVGDYVGASILFIIFAVILLGAARFWKSFHEQREGLL